MRLFLILVSMTTGCGDVMISPQPVAKSRFHHSLWQNARQENSEFFLNFLGLPQPHSSVPFRCSFLVFHSGVPFWCSIPVFHSGVSSNTRINQEGAAIFLCVFFFQICLTTHKSCLQIHRKHPMLLRLCKQGIFQLEKNCLALKTLVLFRGRILLSWRQLQLMGNSTVFAHELRFLFP